MDVDAFISRYGNELLANARRHSATAMDADDAYQRALEILLTKAPAISGDELAAWMHTVVRNAALQTHRRARREVNASFEEISAEWVTDLPQPDERAVESEEYGHRREALARLNPDQARCLLLRADGLGYPEICEITGFSYAKVNRCLSDGRKALRARVSLLDSGAECARLLPVLSMLADNEAPETTRIDAELHLENCLHCRATLREYRGAPERSLVGFPLGVAAVSGSTDSEGWIRRAGDAIESAYAWLQERIATHLPTLHQSGELASAKKVVVALAVTASLVAGGAALEKTVGSGDGHQDGAVAHVRDVNSPSPDGAVDGTRSLTARDRRHARAGAGRTIRNATSADVLGPRAGKDSYGSATQRATNDVSAPSPTNGDPPAGESTPAAPSHSGSSKQFPELAP